MTWVLEEIIQEVHAAYTALTGDTVCAELGNIEKAKNSDTPRIIWTLTGGQFGASTKIGGPDAVMTQALCNFLVWLWFDDNETCWNAMSNLLSALRSTIYGPNLGLLKFDCPTEIEGRHLEKGSVFILSVTISVPLRVDGTVEPTEIVLESHQSTVTEDSGDLTAFETEIVTGPPTP